MMDIQEPWLGLVLSGEKTVEGRAAPPGRWKNYMGEVLKLTEVKGGPARGRALVVEVRHYDTLDEYLDAEWKKAAPQCATREEAKTAYLAVFMDGGVQVFGPDRVRERGGIEAVELLLVV